MDFAHLIPELVLLTSLSGFSALLLVFTGRKLDPESNALVDEINRLLPQTQCAQCGYPGCRPYAEAIASGEAINLCPPGGEETITRLASLLGQDSVTLDPSLDADNSPRVAVIRESECIGCTLCIAACPVDAIVGAQQQMHTVIEARCTGCDLCLEPCPVDCIDRVPAVEPPPLPVFPATQTACINCGLCIDVCPKSLQPQLLFRVREDTQQAVHHDLEQCVECERCDQVCPSTIALTASFRAAKARADRLESERQKAQLNEQRFLARESRLTSSTSKVIRRPSTDDKQALLDALRESS